MIHELRTYDVQPGRAGEYCELSAAVGQPIRGDRYGKLVGYWTTEHGRLNQVVHMWEYADVAARAQARAGLAKDDRWVTEYIPRGQPMLVSQENMLLLPFDWYPLHPATGMGVYELRIYRLRPGKVAEWGRLVQAALPIREKYSSPVGFWQVEVGPLNTVVHIWPYRDLQHRAEVFKALGAEPAWAEFRTTYYPLVQAQESKILVPARHSPLH
jgi:hypothetical protein